MDKQFLVRHHAVRSCCGWSLIEALTVLSILGVIVTLAAPAMRQLIARQQQDSASAQLEAHLALTRSAALTRRTRVTLSPIAEGWGSGWRVYLDPNGNGAWEEGEPVLAEGGASRGVTITAKGPMQRYVSYDDAGLPVQVNGAFLAGTWRICAAGARTTQRLILSATGRVRRETEEGATCS